MNIINYLEIKLKTTNPFKTIKLLHSLKINIYKIEYVNNYLFLKIDHNDFLRIKKIYPIMITNYYGFSKIKYNLKKNCYYYISFFIVVALIFFYTSIIADIHINTLNPEIKKTIITELENNNLQKFHFVKKAQTIEKIKADILKKHHDLLEWINIERRGMTYFIELEPKVDKKPENEAKYCNIISTQDATITRIIAEKGLQLVDPNDSVKKGDILISGDITTDNVEKKQICAKGIVYGNTWYTLNIKTTKTHKIIKRTGKKHHNLVFKYQNRLKKAFPDKYSQHEFVITKDFNIFGFQIIIEKEYEIEEEIKDYTKEELNQKISELVNENLNRQLNHDYQIIDKKVLNNQEKNSTIITDIFIVVEQPISTIDVIS